MFRLFGFYTQNSRKALYVMEALETDFEFVFTDLTKGEQRSDEFRAMTPVGKAPVLEHDGRFLFESGAICRYAANVAGSDLYPTDPWERAMVDQWLDYFVCHAGRWLTTLYFQKVMKARAGLGGPDVDAVDEATKFASQQLKAVERHLVNRDFLANDRLSIADLTAYAYVEQEHDVGFSLKQFPHTERWYRMMNDLDVIKSAKARLPQ